MSDLRGRAGQRAPGWYRDPEDPALLRHWSGRSWSTRRRSWPAWDVAGVDVVADLTLPGGPAAPGGGPAFDGPVDPAPMPAAARRAALGVDGSLAWLQRPDLPVSRRPRHGQVRTGVPARRVAAHPPGWGPSRRPLAVFSALVAVAVLLMAISVGVARPRTATVGAVIHDATYVSRAASTCRAGLGVLRSDGTASMAAAPAGDAEAATVAVRDASSAAGVVAGLRRLIPAPDARGAVADWLSSWDGYVTDQRQLAGALRAPSPAGSPTGSGPDIPQLASRVLSDVIQADAFAEGNGLAACRLGAAEAPVGSVVPIP